MRLVFLLVSLLSQSGLGFQTEFVRSFIARPWMLTNRSLHDPTPDKSWNQATLSIYLDNWSPHSLKLAGDEIRSGTFSQGLMPHDVTSYNRDLALRSLSSKETQKTSGMVSWTVTEKNTNKLAVFTLGWDVGNGIESKFSVRLGLDEPSYESLWQKSKNNRMASTNQLDNTIYVGGLAALRFVAAANMTMNDGDTTHYRLRVSFVPANIDVWGWVKYYREPHELTAAKQNNKIKPTAKPASNRRPNEGQKMEKTGGLFEKKYLLENDTQLTMLSKQNMTLRKALALLNESVALGLLVENWSAYPLGPPTLEITEGKVIENKASIPGPSSVKPGAANVGMVLQSKILTGTSGVVRWTLGSEDLVLSVMWSVPYNRQFWRTWLAVGLSSHSDLPSYQEMYKSSSEDARFVRRQSGYRFEFSDGKFIVIADMDSHSTHKPILRVALVPRDNDLLASNIRTQLGLKQVDYKPLDYYNYQKTQGHKNIQSSPSVVGLTGSSNAEKQVLNIFLTSMMLLLSIKLFAVTQ